MTLFAKYEYSFIVLTITTLPDQPDFIPISTDRGKAQNQNLYRLLLNGPKLDPQEDGEEESHPS